LAEISPHPPRVAFHHASAEQHPVQCPPRHRLKTTSIFHGIYFRLLQCVLLSNIEYLAALQENRHTSLSLSCEQFVSFNGKPKPCSKTTLDEERCRGLRSTNIIVVWIDHGRNLHWNACYSRFLRELHCGSPLLLYDGFDAEIAFPLHVCNDNKVDSSSLPCASFSLPVPTP